MDTSVWISAGFSLAGTAVGGALSIWASVAAQRHQAKSTRALMIVQQMDSAADTAIQKFSQLKQHIQGRPPAVGPDVLARYQTWERALQQQTVKLEPTLLRIRDPALRQRLTKITSYLNTPEMHEWTLGGSYGLLENLCAHALECLGHSIRDEGLPAEDHSMVQARQAETTIEEYWEEQAREAEEGNH